MAAWRAVAARVRAALAWVLAIPARVLVPVRAWWARQLGYFPALAYALGVLGDVARIVARVSRATDHTAGHAVSVSARWVWRKVRPRVLDARGWLVHTAPRLALRLAWRAAVAVVTRGPHIGWWLVQNSTFATVWLLGHLARYLSAHSDYAGVLALAKEEGRVKTETRLRKQWRKAAKVRLGVAAVVVVAVFVTVTVLADRYGPWIYWGAGTVYVLITAPIGRKLRGPAEEPTPQEQEKAEGEPYPIADAHTRAEAADCVARAVRAESIDLRMVGDAARQPWGWQVPIILRRGTPADVVGKLGALETTLDLPSGGLLAAPDRGRRARVVLRLAERDPFATPAYVPPRTPGSVSLRDWHSVARRMDGTDLALNLYGVHVVVIGVPGSGKSQTLRALADAVSASCDAQAWDLDPSGNGLDALGGGIARRERDHAGIESALADAVALAESRPKMLTDLDMGDAWEVSPERPGVVVFVDEYPQLTDKAKALAVSLLRVGRKSRVQLVLASAEATSDTLGAAIADSAACKILMPCRHADVRLVLGPNMLAEGWRPDRLNPSTGDSPEDAGKAYVYAAGSREPLVSKFHTLPADTARAQGGHRAAHGLPRIDTESWEAARARRRAAGVAGEPAETGVSTVDAQAVTDVLTVFDTDDRLWTDDLLSRLCAIDSRYREWGAEELAAALAPMNVAPGQIKIGGRNRRGYHRQTIADAWADYRRHGPTPI